MSDRSNHTRGRGWAYAGAILGGTISIAANVAHSFVPPADATGDWVPQPGAVVGSMFWPILLFVAVEILARVAWPRGFWYALLRLGGLLPVAGVAALVSFRHLRALLIYYGEDPIVAIAGPLAIDGLMVMATAALLVTGRAVLPFPVTVRPSTQPDEDSLSPSAVAATAGGNTSVPAHLVSTARFAVANHANTTGRPITADELAARMNITSALAQQVLDGVTDVSMPVLNGTVVGGDRR